MLFCALCGREITLPDSEPLFFRNENGAAQTDRVCRSCAGLLRDVEEAACSGEPGAVEKYGAARDSLLAAKRLAKCQPLHRQKSIEYDQVP